MNLFSGRDPFKKMFPATKASRSSASDGCPHLPGSIAAVNKEISELRLLRAKQENDASRRNIVHNRGSALPTRLGNPAAVIIIGMGNTYEEEAAAAGVTLATAGKANYNGRNPQSQLSRGQTRN